MASWGCTRCAASAIRDGKKVLRGSWAPFQPVTWTCGQHTDLPALGNAQRACEDTLPTLRYAPQIGSSCMEPVTVHDFPAALAATTALSTLSTVR